MSFETEGTPLYVLKFNEGIMNCVKNKNIVDTIEGINMEAKQLLSRQYKPLSINTKLSDELTAAINSFIEYINYGSGSAEDCYRDEVDFWLKDSFGKLSDADYRTLRQYYVLGGIYAENGYPWEYDKKYNSK